MTADNEPGTQAPAEYPAPHGYQPGYQPHGGPGTGYPAAPRNGLGIAALVLGIIGALSGLIPFLFWLAGLLGVLAVVFGLIGRGRAKRGEASNKGQATAGFVLGIVSLILAVIGIVILANAVNDLNNCFKNASSSSCNN